MPGDRKGATAVEYGLVLGILAMVIITALATLQESVAAIFARVVEALWA